MIVTHYGGDAEVEANECGTDLGHGLYRRVRIAPEALTQVALQTLLLAVQ